MSSATGADERAPEWSRPKMFVLVFRNHTTIEKHMDGTAEHIRAMVEAGVYDEAYRLGKEAIDAKAPNGDIIAALLGLTAKLRSNCMDLAAKKQDVGPRYRSMEDLLREANKLTGEDMYGRFL
jgi:hypothetical protein